MKPRLAVVIGLCGLFALAGAAPARADDGPFVGRWHWSRTESTLPPGEPAPSDMVIEVAQANPGHLRWSVTVTPPQGQPSVQSFDAPADGTFHQIDKDTTAAFRLNGPTLQATFRGPAGQSDTMSCTVLPNRQKMACRGSLTGQDGKTATYQDVFDRG